MKNNKSILSFFSIKLLIWLLIVGATVALIYFAILGQISYLWVIIPLVVGIAAYYDSFVQTKHIVKSL